MKLAFWAEAANVLACFTAAGYAKEIDGEVLGALEVQLYPSFKPMLGRHGRWWLLLFTSHKLLNSSAPPQGISLPCCAICAADPPLSNLENQ